MNKSEQPSILSEINVEVTFEDITDELTLKCLKLLEDSAKMKIPYSDKAWSFDEELIEDLLERYVEGYVKGD